MCSSFPPGIAPQVEELPLDRLGERQRVGGPVRHFGGADNLQLVRGCADINERRPAEIIRLSGARRAESRLPVLGRIAVIRYIVMKRDDAAWRDFEIAGARISLDLVFGNDRIDR